MRCTKARRLMLLYREEELPPAQRMALSRHYASCAECAGEAARLAAEYAPLEELRHTRPELHDPAHMTLGVMRAIDTMPFPRPTAESSPRGVEWLLPGLRRAGPAVAGVLFLLYATLSYTDARLLASLEERIAHQTRRTGSTAEQLAGDVENGLRYQHRTAYAESGIRPDRAADMLQILINPRQAAARVTVEDLLLRKYPSLASVTLQDGLDERERTILAGDGERFLKDLERLIRKENVTHEP